MKKRLLALMMTFAIALSAVVPAFAAKTPVSTLVWNGDSDKVAAANIEAVQNNTRKNASGAKITSNAHSADFPGIYFIWDSKQKDNGYLKVDAEVFDKYDGFVLTSKESSTYWDFAITVQPGQALTGDNCYVFFIPRAQNNKNINMVFISDKLEKDNPIVDPIEINLGFIGYYLFEGKVLSLSFYWQNLSEGDCIDWKGVDEAYAGWVADGGLVPERALWLTSGPNSFTFEDYDKDITCFGDFTQGQMETYYKSWYVSPGYKLPVMVSYERYRAYVKLWNDLYLDPEVSEDDKKTLHDEGGIEHYRALLESFGAESLPSYWHFDLDMKTKYDEWADALEVGLLQVSGYDKDDLAKYVKNFKIED